MRLAAGSVRTCAITGAAMAKHPITRYRRIDERED